MSNELLIPSHELSIQYDCNLFLKPEWYGPTKSHKDKWAAEAAKLAVQNSATQVVAMSSGNQGLALAYACRQEGIGCTVCVESIIEPVYFDLYKAYGASVDVQETEAEQYNAFEKYVEQGYFPLGITHRQREAGQDLPAIDGYRLTAIEIIESLGDVPDVVVFPTSYADHSEGALREFIDLNRQRKIHKVPRFILARANLHTGAEAKSIATDTTTRYVEDVQTRSEGKSVFVATDEMQKAKADILSHTGWNIELSSAASIASLEKLSADDLKDKVVVVVLTALEDK